MTHDEKIEGVSQIMLALSNPKRISVVRTIGHDEKCVTSINQLLNFSQPNLSQHLSVLRDADIVEVVRRGNLRCYRLKNPGKVLTIVNAAIDMVE